MMTRIPRRSQLLFASLCLICLSARATDPNVVTVEDPSGNTANVKYEAIGCFADKSDRSLRVLYYNARSLIEWSENPNFTNIILACVKNAYQKGYKSVFGIQFYGECWSDDSAEIRYNMYNVSNNCAHGVGEHWANMVYRMSVVPKSPVSQPCNINGMEYSNGAEMLIPNDWSSNPANAKCMRCVCSDGQAKDCRAHISCETGFAHLCSKWRNATGKCCPVCDCYHDDKEMAFGSTWAVREGEVCSECTCGADRIATCTTAQKCICSSDEYDEVPVPGKCCPKCVPKSTTTTPTTPPIVLPQTTERPPPTFPPPPTMP